MTTRHDPPHDSLPARVERPTVLALAPIANVGPLDLYAALLSDATKATTKRAREQDVADLQRFLASLGRDEPNPAVLCARIVANPAGEANALGDAYRRSMLDRGLAPSTINRRLSTLRRLVKLGRRYGLCDWSVDFDGVKARTYKDTAGPGVAGMRALLDRAKAEAAEGAAAGKRNWSIVSLLYCAGLRRFELVGLDYPGDVDLDGRRVRVLGKGRLEADWLPMAKAAAPMAEWLKTRGHAPGPLYVRLDRAAGMGLERLSDDGLHFIVSELGKRAGLSRPVWPHAIRHAAVTRAALKTDGNIVRVQGFSRHSSVETVKLYIDRMHDAAQEVSELLGDDL
jgi:integrase/recombinase XerC